MMSWRNMIWLRMKRQNLYEAVGRNEYETLFRNMSPVPTMYWTRPGDPPTLPSHADFDDYEYNTRCRARRELLKGRFGGGTIAYVTKEDMELFGCLYQKEISRYTQTQSEIIELFEQEGPMNIKLIKELTGLLVKAISPQLHKLQEAFVVYEDQLDNEWDRGWYLFKSEFPEIDLSRYTKKEALKRLLPRVFHLMVFADDEQLKSYYRLPVKQISEAVRELVQEGALVEIIIEGKKGYMRPEDITYLESNTLDPYEPKIILIQKNDFLARAYADRMKSAFPADWDSLYYILVDGEFHGIVAGRFRFGPHDVEDIMLDLSEYEKRERREEIIEAVYQIFDKDSSPIKRYCGHAM